MHDASDASLVAIARQHLALPLTPLERVWLSTVLARWEATGRLAPEARGLVRYVGEKYAEEVARL